MRLHGILPAVLVLAFPLAARAAVHVRPYTPLHAALQAVATRQGVPFEQVLADPERWLTGDRAPGRRVAEAESGVLGPLGWDDPAIRFALPLQLGWGRVRIASGDFDGDGIADLAVASGFGAATILAGGANAPPLQVRGEVTLAGGDLLECAADVDGDGRCDLVASGYYDSMVVVHRSLGSGGFAPARRYRVPVQFPYGGWYDDRPEASVTPADLTGNGRPDFVVTGVWDSLIVTLVNTGAGEFVVGPETNVGGWVKARTVADFDGDARQDIALVRSGEWSAVNIRVLLSRGDGTFEPPNVVPAPGWGLGSGLEAGDIDADGRADLVAYGDDGNLRVLAGGGDGTFSERCTVPLGDGGYGSCVRSVDLDGDGRLDVVASHRGSEYASRLAVLSGSQAEVLSGPRRYLGYDRVIYHRPICYALVCADFDADGDPDLADLTDGYLSIVLNDRGGTLSAPGFVRLAFSPWSVASARLGPGARPDLLLWDGTSTWVSRGRGAREFEEAAPCAAGEVVSTRDLDANGTEDLVLANGDTNTVVLNDGAGGLAVAGVYLGGSFLTCADFDAVNGPDLAVADSNSHVLFRLNDGLGSFGPPVDSGVLLAADATAVHGGDVDQDGRADLLVGRNSGGPESIDSLEVHWNDGSAFAEAQALALTGGVLTHPARVGLGDFDGDGRVDVFVVDGAMGDWSGNIVILHGGGGRALLPVKRYYTGPDPRDGVVADFDRDGLDDIAVVCDNDNTATGFVEVYRGAPGDVVDLGRLYCQHYSTGIATADLDLDGRLDLAVTNLFARTVTLHHNASPAGDPTPAALSLVSADVTEAGVELVWFAGGGGSGAVATVYRSLGSDGWTRLGVAASDGTGHVRYVDPAPASVGRVGYRLGIVVAGVEAYCGETWVDVPVRAAGMALAGVCPNPWRGGPLEVRFTLPTDGPATLDLYDVAGRRIARRRIVGPAAGSQTIGLDEGTSLAPGLYLVRLTQGPETRTRRVAIVR